MNYDHSWSWWFIHEYDTMNMVLIKWLDFKSFETIYSQYHTTVATNWKTYVYKYPSWNNGQSEDVNPIKFETCLNRWAILLGGRSKTRRGAGEFLNNIKNWFPYCLKYFVFFCKCEKKNNLMLMQFLAVQYMVTLKVSLKYPCCLVIDSLIQMLQRLSFKTASFETIKWINNGHLHTENLFIFAF